MKNIEKNSIIVLLIIISIFIINLMDDKKITSLTVENTIARSFNKETSSNVKDDKLSNIRIENDKIYFNVSSSNVASNINEDDLNKLLKSKKKNWKVYNENNMEYNKSYKNGVLRLKNDDFKSLTINDGYKNYLINYHNGFFELSYPSVSIGTKYFLDFESAYNSCDKECEIDLLEDISLSNIEILKDVVINGNYKNIYSDDYLFKLNDSKVKITLNNVKVNIQYLANVSKKNKNKIILNNSKIKCLDVANNKTNVENNQSSLLKFL